MVIRGAVYYLVKSSCCRATAVHSCQTEMETISRTVRSGGRNIRVVQWSIFADVKETENSQAAFRRSSAVRTRACGKAGNLFWQVAHGRRAISR